MLDLMLASKSSYPIDPLLLPILYKLAFIITPFIFKINNISLHSGISPSSLMILIFYLKANSLFDSRQSIYRKFLEIS